MHTDHSSDSDVQYAKDYIITSKSTPDLVGDSCSKWTIRLPPEKSTNFNELSSIYENTEEEMSLGTNIT